ncbi:hypothetical protein KIN20_029927 [Parelaphostrongylus tenuis]|uniref:Uncharacterized protein n=1 Tax=Parelaphostrongylus tenuis TaxID=148309 RepID=A0AAD5R389_PARTN|nr:hypothetical protein KIN20_029927 [Parelaphostrongylus tenuis]
MKVRFTTYSVTTLQKTGMKETTFANLTPSALFCLKSSCSSGPAVLCSCTYYGPARNGRHNETISCWKSAPQTDPLSLPRSPPMKRTVIAIHPRNPLPYILDSEDQLV